MTDPLPPRLLKRRRFLVSTAAAASTALLSRSSLFGQQDPKQDRLRIGVVGVGNRGSSNLGAVSGERIEALCDVDARFLDGASKRFPEARRYRDYREMLDAGGLDAVVVSTPDHAHFPVAKAALEANLDVYCEKPLTHTVLEARELRDLAREKGAITQMGIQIHANENYRKVVELIRSGAIGRVREAHVFCSKTWSGGDRPTDTPEIPEWLEWDLWLCGAKERPYHSAYHPAGWRRFWEFGGGTLADMGCHYLDLAHWALDLKEPESIRARGPEVHRETTPPWIVVDYEHPGTGSREKTRVSWYDGGATPSPLEPLGLSEWKNGILFIGDDGHLVSDYDRHVLGPTEKFADHVAPEPFLEPSPGHHREWLDACRSRKQTSCGFHYSGPLSEAVLLGNIAYRVGRPLQYDTKNARITGDGEANALLG